MHTGTRFFENILLQHYPTSYWGSQGTSGDLPFYIQHCHPRFLDDVERLYETHTLITTYRDPKAVEASWNRRYQHTNGLKEQWGNWAAWIVPHAKFTLSVDQPWRKHELNKLGNFLNLPLSTDWEPIK